MDGHSTMVPAVHRRSAKRRSALVAVTALLAMSLPTFTVDRAAANSDSAPPGIALWANAANGRGGLVWSASSSNADGLVHSNRDLRINGSTNALVGGTEYGRQLRVTGRDNVIDPAATKVAPVDYPVAFDIADYRPGGAVAFAARSQYFDGTAECALDGTWERHIHATEIITGLHYAPCDVIISAADITGSFTIVAEGTIQVTAARMTLGPAFTDDLLFFSNAETDQAILIAGKSSAFDGYVFAPRGSAMLAGANHDVRCGILADEIAISGNGHSFTGDPTCGNRTPIVVDDAFTTDEDVVLDVATPGVLGNDADPDGDPLTAALRTGTSDGTVSLYPDGAFAYTPNLNFHGEDSFTYEACDTGTPPRCMAATVTITVNSVNDAPVADADGPYTGTAGSVVSFDGAGWLDVDGRIVSYE